MHFSRKQSQHDKLQGFPLLVPKLVPRPSFPNFVWECHCFGNSVSFSLAAPRFFAQSDCVKNEELAARFAERSTPPVFDAALRLKIPRSLRKRRSPVSEIVV
jgi:hypothetical protein